MSEMRLFLNGDEAVAWGVRLCRPHVISAYPITPQTIVVEKLAEFVANGELKSEYCYVESEDVYKRQGHPRYARRFFTHRFDIVFQLLRHNGKI